MPNTDVSGLSMLGSQTETAANPEVAVLEKVPSGHAGTDYVVRFTAPEFTSLCPMTGQPASSLRNRRASPTRGRLLNRTYGGSAGRSGSHDTRRRSSSSV